MRAMWRSVWTMSGVQCAMFHGQMYMLELLADNWDYPVHVRVIIFCMVTFRTSTAPPWAEEYYLSQVCFTLLATLISRHAFSIYLASTYQMMSIKDLYVYIHYQTAGLITLNYINSS